MDPSCEDSLQEFQEAIEGPDEDIDLARAALILSKAEYPNLDIDPVLNRLDALAAKVVDSFDDATETPDQIEALSEVLFEDEGLRGASEDYHDPRNSYIHEVLERKLGIPVSLSVIYMSVGARAGIPLAGTAVPMHFLVRVLGVRPPLFVDCFSGGRVLSADQCREGLTRLSSGRISFNEEMFAAVSNRAVLARVLSNLKMIYLNAHSFDKALAVLDRLLICSPGEATLLRERGLVHYRLGSDAQARVDLQGYLDAEHEPVDAQEIRDLLRKIG